MRRTLSVKVFLNREQTETDIQARKKALASIEKVTPFQECPKCGERTPEHFIYCGYCGARIAPEPQIIKPNDVRPSNMTVEQMIEEGFSLSQERRWDRGLVERCTKRGSCPRDPSNQKALRNLGFVLNRMGKHEVAERKLSEGLLIDCEIPSHEASLRYERALARTELKMYDDALADIERSLHLVRHSVKSLYMRARIKLLQGALADAKRDAQEVLQMIPDHSGALRILDQVAGQRFSVN